MNKKDQSWLCEWRERLGIPQSDIAVILRLLLGKPVNQGRIAEIECGQRELSTEWRDALEPFFLLALDMKSRNSPWTDLFLPATALQQAQAA